MKKKEVIAIMILLCGVYGCSGMGNKEESHIMPTNKVNTIISKSGTPINEAVSPTNKEMKDTTFRDMRYGEDTKQMKPLSQMKKIFLSFPNKRVDVLKMMAIDLVKKELYLDYDITEIDTFDPTAKLSDSQIKQVLDILKEEKIQEWKKSYDKERDANGVDLYCWSLDLENSDGTVERHGGMAQRQEDCTPDNYETVIDKIMGLKFIAEKEKK